MPEGFTRYSHLRFAGEHLSCGKTTGKMQNNVDNERKSLLIIIKKEYVLYNRQIPWSAVLRNQEAVGFSVVCKFSSVPYKLFACTVCYITKS